ncbi:MAG: hypothetical protein U9N59_13420 [Campylobacterota bacterium]|nr:hypothetical protein [Campylobacterota bacterium]
MSYDAGPTYFYDNYQKNEEWNESESNQEDQEEVHHDSHDDLKDKEYYKLLHEEQITKDNYKEELIEYVKNSYYKYSKQQRKQIVSFATNDTAKFKILAIKFYINTYIDAMIQEYSKQEKIRNSLMSIIHEDKFIYIVLKGLLFKNLRLAMTNDLYIQIENISNEVLNNTKLDIVYDRVGMLQKFIHDTVQIQQGKNSHLKLDKNLMKDILSSFRLYLNMYDLREEALENIMIIYNKTLTRIEAEFNSPSSGDIMPYKKFIPHWKALKMKPLFKFIPQNFIKNLSILIEENSAIQDELVKKIIEIKIETDKSIYY